MTITTSSEAMVVDDFARAVLRAIADHPTELLVLSAASLVAYGLARHYIPLAAETLFQRNIYGIDINKTTSEERAAFAAKRKAGDVNGKVFRVRAIPESLGIVVGAVYLCCVLVLLLVLGVDVGTMAGPLATIAVMLLLGFVDDVLDVRWRHKIVLSAFGSIPLIMAYDGSRSVLLPPAVRHYVEAGEAVLGDMKSHGGLWRAAADAWMWCQQRAVTSSSGGLLVNLGGLYLVYLSLLCIFCTNSINILAGVNGVEVGQSIVIGMASIVYNIFQLRLEHAAGPADISPDHQLRALVLLVPFVAVSLALWAFNRYPSRVFVGDSYTYFAGTVLAVAGITGVYSKTLLLFFVPQVINFVLSIPQLFRLVPCPRHRVPRWIKERDVLTNSFNYTLLNAILLVCGDMREDRLTQLTLAFQVLTCVGGFVVRYWIAGHMYEAVL